jgi:hypothetical protein
MSEEAGEMSDSEAVVAKLASTLAEIREQAAAMVRRDEVRLIDETPRTVDAMRATLVELRERAQRMARRSQVEAIDGALAASIWMRAEG